MNPAIIITDSQYFDYGPLSAVDKRGQILGPATGLVASSGDATKLTGDAAAAANEEPLAEGALRYRAVGPLGTVQAVATDANGKQGFVDVTIIAGAESGLAGNVGGGVELPA